MSVTLAQGRGELVGVEAVRLVEASPIFAAGCKGLSLRTGAAWSYQKALLEVLIRGGSKQVEGRGLLHQAQRHSSHGL